MRNNTMDVARGIAFGCMLIHHAFYFTTDAHDIPPVVEMSGTVARHLFIVIAGYSLAMQYHNQTNNGRAWRKRLFRCMEVGVHAGLISLVTYACYPNRWVRFGVLHFMSVSLLIASTLMMSKHHELLALCVIFILYCIPKTGTWLDVVSGSHPNYAMIDWFPLAAWFPWLWLGVMLGKYFPLPTVASAPNDALSVGLSFMGQNSLALYTAHFVVFCALTQDGRT
jgi:uncharacterized membrane protein